MHKVKAKSCEGFNISPAMIVGYSPKYTVMCGNCGKIFKKRFNLYHWPEVRCPHCEAINELPLAVDSEMNEMKESD